MPNRPTSLTLSLVVCATAALAGVACGDAATETAEACAQSQLIAQCPAGTQARFEAQATSRCDSAVEGGLVETGGSVTGSCEGSGACRVFCEFSDPCPCGVASLQRDGVLCAVCTGGCGDGVCDPGESSESCVRDCGERCVPGAARCQGDLIQTCTLQSIWDPARDCPGGLRCSEGADSAICSGLAACADNRLSGSEPDVDCGGACPTPCGDGRRCNSNSDCESRLCGGGVCASSACGDGVLQPGEECDDGSAASDTAPNACRTTCRLHACGDGVRDLDEGCDDGGLDDGDGCLATCQVELGHVCAGQPSACVTQCGDGVVAGGEACDDGNRAAGDHCASDCSAVTGRCGDRVLQDNEVCDDGNTVADDGCAANCLSFTGECGNGAIEGNEVCDDGAQCANGTPCDLADSNACAGQSDPSCAARGQDYCSASCSVVTGRCGDGYRQPNEVCDDGNTANGDYCSADCQSDCETSSEAGWLGCPARCGDAITQSNEVCDDGDTVSLDYCLGNCQAITGTCGDGIAQDNEACDENHPYTGPYCSGGCTAWCGDGQRQPSEGCEGVDAVEVCAGRPGPDGVPLERGFVTCGQFCQQSSTERCIQRSRLALGAEHSCFAREDGKVVCWGPEEGSLNDLGQSLPPSTSFEQIFAGTFGTCGLTGAGTAQCWGDIAIDPGVAAAGPFTSLHDSSGSVVGLRDDGVLVTAGGIGGSPELFQQVAIGSARCGVSLGGTVECWGGQTAADLGVPPAPAGLHYTQLGLSEFGCALRSDGEVVCWGPDTAGSTRPPTGPFAQLAVGINFACALEESGEIACWGRAPVTPSNATQPEGRFTQLAVNQGRDLGGKRHACALREDGAVICWGSTSQTAAPLSPPQVQSLSAGSDAVCAHLMSGRALCWGEALSWLVPASPEVFEQVAVSATRACGLRGDGSLKCWGAHVAVDGNMGSAVPRSIAMDAWGVVCGILGDRNATCSEVRVGGSAAMLHLGPYVMLDGGGDFFCGVRGDQSVSCFVPGLPPGSGNDFGRLTPPAGQYTDVAAGGNHACATNRQGGVVCWGDNETGQAAPPAGLGYVALEAHGDTSCALSATGTITCWGATGDLGSIPAGLRYEDLALGDGFVCGLGSDRATIDCTGVAVGVSGGVPGLAP